MRRLEIDWGELSTAFESGLEEMEYYLDLETGKVLMVSQETRWYRNEPLDDELRGWQQAMLETARRVEEGYGTRYIRIPERDKRENYQDMEWFITTVQDEGLQEKLWGAVKGQGAFRRFKDALLDHPDERERWFAFEKRRVHERLVEWLKDKGIEATNPVDLSDMPER
jgi:hypothetical protein